MPIKVIVAETFLRSALRLKKRYPRVFSDVETLKIQLESGETPGDRLKGFDRLIYKVRLRNSNAQRGKSGGYRVVYYIETAEHIILLTIYSKSEQSDIPADVLRRIIQDYEPPLSRP